MVSPSTAVAASTGRPHRVGPALPPFSLSLRRLSADVDGSIVAAWNIGCAVLNRGGASTPMVARSDEGKSGIDEAETGGGADWAAVALAIGCGATAAGVDSCAATCFTSGNRRIGSRTGADAIASRPRNGAT